MGESGVEEKAAGVFIGAIEVEDVSGEDFEEGIDVRFTLESFEEGVFVQTCFERIKDGHVYGVFGFEVPVHGRFGNAADAGDFLHADVVVSSFAEEPGGFFEDLRSSIRFGGHRNTLDVVKDD
jgi:hypothetical protein